jgi:hypothetical protein
MLLPNLLACASAALLLAMVPGPSTAVVLRQTLRSGRRAALAATLANELGSLFWVLAAAVGLSALVAASQLAYDVLRLVGALVLVALGAQSLWRARRGAPLLTLAAAVAADPGEPHAERDLACLSGWTCDHHCEPEGSSLRRLVSAAVCAPARPHVRDAPALGACLGLGRCELVRGVGLDGESSARLVRPVRPAATSGAGHWLGADRRRGAPRRRAPLARYASTGAAPPLRQEDVHPRRTKRKQTIREGGSSLLPLSFYSA